MVRPESDAGRDWPGGGDHKPGIFLRLKELQPGDGTIVKRVDGLDARFVTNSVDHFRKAAFPTERVYGDVANPELRLITCGGPFDRTARSYLENIVVFATLDHL